MNISKRCDLSAPRRSVWILFVAGVVLMVGAWVFVFEIEGWFTDSHLAGYYCCVTERDLPARGTLARTVSDFFHAFPGKHLPSLVFVAANLWIFVLNVRHNHGKYRWWLPFLFTCCVFVYLLVDYWLVGISWSISNRLVGPSSGAYKGYDRTWYGIVLHLMLWVGYFAALSTATEMLMSKSAIVSD